MKVKTFILGPLQTSCYLVYNENANSLIVDAGGDPAEMIKYIKQNHLMPLYLVNTHGHIDHILGNPQIKKAFPKIRLCIHKADAPMLAKSEYNLATELGLSFTSPEPDQLVNENDVISLSDREKDNQFKVIHLPGHTQGGIGLWYHSENSGQPAGSSANKSKKSMVESLLFSGDAIFAGSIGRTDFPGGSHEELINNIAQKIFTLPENTIIFPGHGPMTTVGQEKESNPFFSGGEPLSP